MISRIGEYGASPNKLASLGLNLILLVNLSGAAWLQLRFIRGRTTFGHVERWQTAVHPGLPRVGGDRRGRVPAGLRVRLSRSGRAIRPGSDPVQP